MWIVSQASQLYIDDLRSISHTCVVQCFIFYSCVIIKFSLLWYGVRHFTALPFPLVGESYPNTILIFNLLSFFFPLLGIAFLSLGSSAVHLKIHLLEKKNTPIKYYSAYLGVCKERIWGLSAKLPNSYFLLTKDLYI